MPALSKPHSGRRPLPPRTGNQHGNVYRPKPVERGTEKRYNVYISLWKEANRYLYREELYELRTGDAMPTQEEFINYLDWWTAKSTGKLDESVTFASAEAHWRGFRAAWKRVTGRGIPEGISNSASNYLKTLGLPTIMTRKDLFTSVDLDNIMLFMWTYDDCIYIHERMRVQL
ncbi:hypothetical protein EX30DRAFT_364912 [Ascodesmis nigricans]|uniref:Uncharacterized protein n=1 Tax=Ascodesmis nigricans TaxID=341454 RepID=A0A4S2MTP5_9PEZI|nr:hypothetical protein EX30DRAFT_364912 [Ascodesmis nigricans]